VGRAYGDSNRLGSICGAVPHGFVDGGHASVYDLTLRLAWEINAAGGHGAGLVVAAQGGVTEGFGDPPTIVGTAGASAPGPPWAEAWGFACPRSRAPRWSTRPSRTGPSRYLRPTADEAPVAGARILETAGVRQLAYREGAGNANAVSLWERRARGGGGVVFSATLKCSKREEGRDAFYPRRHGPRRSCWGPFAPPAQGATRRRQALGRIGYGQRVYHPAKLRRRSRN